MTISQKQTLPHTWEQLTFFQADSPANPTAQQAKDLAKRTTVIYGQKCLEPYGRLNPPGLWAKTFMALLIGTMDWYSTRCKLTWKRKATQYNRVLFQLVPSTLPIEETESGLLLQTPTVRQTCEAPEAMRARAEKNGYKNGTKYNSLTSQIMYDPKVHAMFPTPTSVQRDHPERVEKLKATGATTMMSRAAGENRPNSVLDAAMFYGLMPTPTVNDMKNQSLPPSQAERNDSIVKRILVADPKAGQDGQLNPRFVAEMMGFPTDWLELPFQNIDQKV